MQSKISIWGWYQAQSTHFGLKGIKILYSSNISTYHYLSILQILIGNLITYKRSPIKKKSSICINQRKIFSSLPIGEKVFCQLLGLWSAHLSLLGNSFLFHHLLESAQWPFLPWVLISKPAEMLFSLSQNKIIFLL